MMNDRAVSTTVGYVLNVSVAMLLVTGLLVTGSNFVEDQRERAVRTELQVLGQQVASEAAAADRLVRESGTEELEFRQALPETVAGTSYTIEIDPPAMNEYEITLQTRNPSVTVSVRLYSETDIDTEGDNPVSGGDLAIRYTGTGLEVRHE